MYYDSYDVWDVVEEGVITGIIDGVNDMIGLIDTEDYDYED